MNFLFWLGLALYFLSGLVVVPTFYYPLLEKHRKILINTAFALSITGLGIILITVFLDIF